ncbi:MAG TPA: tetratricopeptide repeat protein [Candidatus Kapabacteria bacterium]|nr:tetratricopeptide repeat protein [Candidatus Kapabacteria bacterium]
MIFNMNFMKRKSQKILISMAIAVLLAVDLYGAPLGKLRITVLDSMGKPVPGIKVTINDTVDENLVFTVTTDKQGIAVQVGLQNHVVRVTLEKEGYRSIIKNIKIPVGLLVEERFTISTVAESLRQQEAGDPHAEAVQAFNEAVPLIKEKKYDDAAAALKKSVALDNTLFQPYYYLGMIYFEQGKHQEAVEPLSDVIRLNPDYGPAYRLLAAVYEKLGNNTQAEKYRKLAQEKGGKTPADAYNEGIDAFNAGNMDKAIQAFDEALKLDDTFAPAYYQLGMSYVNKGENEKAIAALKKFLELKPEGEEAETARSIIESFK